MDVTYPSPVTVNGFRCANCSEVDLAARHVDPQHPRSGAYDVDAASDPTRSTADKARLARHAASVVAAGTYRAGGASGSAASPLGIAVDRLG